REEVVADGDEVRRVAVIAPGGQDGAQQRQQESGDQEAGQGASATGRTSSGCGTRDVHYLRLYYFGRHAGERLGGGGASRGANRVQPTNSKGGNWCQSPLCGVLAFEICRRRSRKRKDPGAVVRSFSRLRVARGVQQP